MPSSQCEVELEEDDFENGNIQETPRMNNSTEAPQTNTI